jgi:hypothetical protein
MNSSNVLSAAGRLGAIAFAMAMSGCAMDAGLEGEAEEDLGSVSSAFTSNQCASATAAATVSGQFVWNSPSNYGGNCNAVDHAGASSLYLPYGASITANQGPTTQATCEATYIRTVFYKKNGSGVWVAQKDESNYGVWQAGPFGVMECANLGTSYPPQGTGVQVRMATTARRPSGSSFVTYPITAVIWRKPT